MALINCTECRNEISDKSTNYAGGISVKYSIKKKFLNFRNTNYDILLHYNDISIAKYNATCNSLDPGGVITPLNECVMNDPKLWAEIMDETPLKRWATTEEIAQWAYFLTVTNTFCTGQCILVDGGESINYNFVWKD